MLFPPNSKPSRPAILSMERSRHPLFTAATNSQNLQPGTKSQLNLLTIYTHTHTYVHISLYIYHKRLYYQPFSEDHRWRTLHCINGLVFSRKVCVINWTLNGWMRGFNCLDLDAGVAQSRRQATTRRDTGVKEIYTLCTLTDTQIVVAETHTQSAGQKIIHGESSLIFLELNTTSM